MTRIRDVEVLVVGAGPTGLVLAAELWRRGITCRLIDSLPKPSLKSRALAVHARTLEPFEMMGIVDGFLKHGWRSDAFTVFDRKIPIVRMTFGELDSHFPYVLSLPQVITEQLLAEQCRNLGGSVEWESTVTTLTQSEDSVTAVVTKPDGSSRTVKCAWLVGCDGSHSSVRELIQQPFRGMQYWEEYVLADIEYETSLNPRDHYLFSNDDGVAGLHVFSNTSARMFADVAKIRRPRSTDTRYVAESVPELAPEEIQRILDARGPGSVHVKKVNWLSMHRIHRRLVDSYKSGRVLLAGDAAHIHSPTSGQGMNLGIQDAYNLAWKLALVQRKQASEALIDSYNEERRLAAKQIAVMSDFFTRINEVRSPLLKFVRTTLGPVLASREDVRERYRRAVANLACSYRLSPIVSESVSRYVGKGASSHSPPCAGDRAPDVDILIHSTGAKQPLLSVLRDIRHQLLIFTGPTETANSESVTEILSLASKHSVLMQANLISPSQSLADPVLYKVRNFYDCDFSAHKKYAPCSSALYLVRPDGYVAFRCLPTNVNELKRYIHRLCGHLGESELA